MKTNKLVYLTTAVIILLAACKKESLDASGSASNKNSDIIANSAAVKVFATGLNNPRGLKWGPDGNLYVAEGGTGGKDSTVGICKQVPSPVGPYYGSSHGGRISVITPNGRRFTFAKNFPSSQTNAGTGGFISGVADVDFLGDGAMYALIGGAGCSHGVQSMDNGVVRIKSDGTWKMIANLSAFLRYHHVANPEPDDFEPDGTWYSMVRVSGAFYALEPNHGELDKITPDG